MELPLPIGFAALLLAALVLEPLAARLRLPFATLLVIFGFVASELIVAVGVDTTLRWHHFHGLVLHVLLPVLIFESAINLELGPLRKNLVPILVLAIPGVILATVITAALLYLGIGHPAGFPWLAALVAGVLLSATDPVAVVGLFRRLGVPERLAVLLEGESLFNDATAIVLYAVLVPMAVSGSAASGWAPAGLHFAWVFLGGLAVGVAGGGTARLMLPLCQSVSAKALATLAIVVITYYAAEYWLGVSGVMSVLAAGLMTGDACRRGRDDFVMRFWALNGYVANAIMFLLAGVTITVGMFTERWLAMLIGIGAVLVTRAALTLVILPLVSRPPAAAPLPRGYALVSYWGGLRGAVTLALALALPFELDNWWDIQSIAYGVTLFTLLVQAPTMPWLIRHLRLDRRPPPG